MNNISLLPINVEKVNQNLPFYLQLAQAETTPTTLTELKRLTKIWPLPGAIRPKALGEDEFQASADVDDLLPGAGLQTFENR